MMTLRRYPICHIPPRRVDKEETLEEEARRVLHYYNDILWKDFEDLGGIDKMARRIAGRRTSFLRHLLWFAIEISMN